MTNSRNPLPHPPPGAKLDVMCLSCAEHFDNVADAGAHTCPMFGDAPHAGPGFAVNWDDPDG